MAIIEDPRVEQPEEKRQEPTLRLYRPANRLLTIERDDGTTVEYQVRARLDVETMAVLLETEEVLTSGRHPVTGQPLTAKEKADHFREAHRRVVALIQEENPSAQVSFDSNELLAVIAMVCGNISFAQQIAEDLRGAGVSVVEPGEGEPGADVEAGSDSPLA